MRHLATDTLHSAYFIRDTFIRDSVEKEKKYKGQIRDKSCQNFRNLKGQDMSQFHGVPY